MSDQSVDLSDLRRLSAGDFIRRAALNMPERVALIFNNEEISFADINTRANQVAHSLIKDGVVKGDRVSFVTWNCPEFLYTMFACFKIGAIFNPINVMLSPSEVEYILNHSNPKVLFIEDILQEKLTEKKPSNLKKIYVVKTAGSPVPEQWIDYGTLLANDRSIEEPISDCGMFDPLGLIYTSGTESSPKGVLVSHFNLYMTVFATGIATLKITKEDNVLVSVPINHIAGLVYCCGSVAVGTKLVLQHHPDLEEATNYFEKYDINHIFWPPTLFMGLVQFLGSQLKEYPKMSKMTTFGNPFPSREALLTCAKIFPNALWLNYWGMTETTPAGAAYGYVPMNDETALKFVKDCIGTPNSQNEIKIFDENDKEVATGQIGEIVVRSPSLMLGYYKDPEKTADVFKNDWHHSGDLGRIDPDDGLLYFVDRKKDVVKSGGENVSSVEVETCIALHPKVGACAVVGIPHPYWSEAVVAVVAPNPDTTITEDEIISWCKEKISNFKVPKKVVVTDFSNFPVNASGKILKRDLRDSHRELFKDE